MKILNTINDLRQTLKPLRTQKVTPNIALVPTMGNLHDGHLQLVKIAKQHADIVVVSIFVNPTQFGVGEDFDSYPRTLEADVAKIAGVADYVFAPSVAEMYPTFPPHIQVLSGEITQILCGKSRPIHFDGVGLVVGKLFNIVQPDIAIFGKKDYQQLAIIRQMVSELNFPIEIIGAEIVRADDGLALSSRNQYLSKTERNIAPQIQQALQSLKAKIQQANFSEFENLVEKTKHTLNSNGFNVDYLELRNQNLQPVTPSDKSLVLITAVWLGKARLLDNLEVMLNWK